MILNIVTWAAAGLLVALVLTVVAILCTPLRVSAEVDTEGAPRLRLRIAILGCRFPVYSTKRSRVHADARKAKRVGAKGRGKSALKDIIAYAPYVARAVPRFVCGIVSRIRIEAINVDVSFGLPDPADTGALYGALTPIALLLGMGKAARVTLRPDFANAVLKGRGQLRARFTPIALALPALAFGWAVFVSPRLPDALR